MAVPINVLSLNLQKPNLIAVLRSRVLYGTAESLSFTRLFKPSSYRIRVRSFQKENIGKNESEDEMLKSESTRVSEKKRVSLIAKLGIGLGLALTITVICVTLKGSASGGTPFDVKSLSKASSSSIGFTFNAFGNRFVIPANAPGWVYFCLLMAAGFGLFISEEALNIWVCGALMLDYANQIFHF